MIVATIVDVDDAVDAAVVIAPSIEEQAKQIELLVAWRRLKLAEVMMMHCGCDLTLAVSFGRYEVYFEFQLP